MRFVWCFLLLVIRIGQASETLPGWSAWLFEGQSFSHQGNYSAAAHAFREALAIAAHSAIDDWQLVVLHDALAGAYAEVGQFPAAEGEYRRALALVEKDEGQGSRHYALLLGQMAILPTQTGNRAEVIALLRQAIAVNAAMDPPENLALLRECLAQIFRREKRYQEAEPLLLDVLAGLARQKAPDQALTAAALNNLAVLRFDQERYQESVDLQLRSIRVWETALGNEHSSLVAPLNNLAATYLKMSRFDEAGLTLERALNVCRKTLGQNHPDYAVLLKNDSVVLRKLGRKREAREFKELGQQVEKASNRRNGLGATVGVTALRSERP
jgi:tetratricopeptide (TPR) repeat protein